MLVNIKASYWPSSPPISPLQICMMQPTSLRKHDVMKNVLSKGHREVSGCDILCGTWCFTELKNRSKLLLSCYVQNIAQIHSFVFSDADFTTATLSYFLNIHSLPWSVMSIGPIETNLWNSWQQGHLETHAAYKTLHPRRNDVVCQFEKLMEMWAEPGSHCMYWIWRPV